MNGADGETVMRHVFLALTTLIVASGGNTAFAQYDCHGWATTRAPCTCGTNGSPPVRLRRYQALGWKYVPVVRLAEHVSEPICSLPRVAKPLLRASVIHPDASITRWPPEPSSMAAVKVFASFNFVSAFCRETQLKE